MTDLKEAIRHAIEDHDHGRIIDSVLEGRKITALPQRAIIESTLEALADLCPDWDITAEPTESVIEAERETDVGHNAIRRPDLTLVK